MAQHNDLGKYGEEYALSYLRKKKFEILDCNWQFKKYEIDIIARKNDLLIVVEVKTRRSDEHGAPESFVTKSKQRQLIKAINEYVSQRELHNEIRFDIISIVVDRGKPVMEHIEDAFYAIVK